MLDPVAGSRRGSIEAQRGEDGVPSALHTKPMVALTRQGILVLGMHRSGTSALTRVLNLLGAELPSDLVEADRWNERGVWESCDIMALHDQLLGRFSSSWDDPSLLDLAAAPETALPVFKQLLAVLERDFSSTSLFMVKDPRICRFVPLWLSLFKYFGATPHIAIIVRNPFAVGASLYQRDQLRPMHAYRLWLRHVLDAERATRQLPRGFILYHDLVSAWRPAVERLVTEMKLARLKPRQAAAASIEQFVSSTLQHHVDDTSCPLSSYQLLDWLGRTYSAVADLAACQKTSEAYRKLDHISLSLDREDRTQFL